MNRQTKQFASAWRESSRSAAVIALGATFLLWSGTVSRAGSIFDDDYTPPKHIEPKPQQPPPATLPRNDPVPATLPPVVAPSTPAAVKPPVIVTNPVNSPALVDRSIRGAIPPAGDLANVRKLFVEVYSHQLADQSPKGKRALALQLIGDAAKAAGTPVDRFVMLTGARHAAIDAGDTESAIAADNELCAAFAIDSPKSRLDLVTRLSKTARSPASCAMVVRECIRVADEAEAGGDYDTPTSLLDAAVEAAKWGESGLLIKQAAARQARASEVASAWADAQKPLATLKTSPSDPAANLAVGRFYCLLLGQWSTGLRFLAASSDANFSAAAKADLKAVDPASIAAGWATLAAQETPVAKRHLQLRAAKWYRDAIATATGLQKLKAQHDLSMLISGPFRADARTLNLSTELPAETILAGGAGLVVLASACGHFEGGGEHVGVKLSEDGSWQSECSSFQGKLLYSLISYPQADGLGLAAEIEEYHWKRGEPKVKMIRRADGFCFLSQISGHFVGGGERVGVSLGRDGFWYLDCASGQSDLSARAISIKPNAARTFSTEFREVAWKAGAPPVQVIRDGEGICFLSMVHGGLRGGGDFVGLERKDDGFWYLRGSGNIVAAKAIAIHYLPEIK